MNYRNAYNGLAATYRNLRKKLTLTLQENGLLQAKVDAFTAEDPQLAYYIDANHALNNKLRDQGEQIAEYERQNSKLRAANIVLRKSDEHAGVLLAIQKKYTKVWQCVSASFVVASIVIHAYLYPF